MSPKQPSVMEVMSDPACPAAVLLGDPGSGKSTLAQYVALRWVEDRSEPFPILIELRKYATDETSPRTFLDFLHGGKSHICRLDQHYMDQRFKAGNAIVIFDALDEITTAATRNSIVNEIVRFAKVEYPLVRVVVTSRVIGFQPSAHSFRTAGFRQFTIYDFGDSEISSFLESVTRSQCRTLPKGLFWGSASSVR